MLQIRQRFVDLIVAIIFRDQALQLDPAERRHLKNFFDVIGLAARYTGDRYLTGDKTTAADRERPVAQTADDRCRATGTGRLYDLVGSLWVADRFECLVDAAV